ncbi:MAG: flagellar motor protein MotA [Alphaproteobacteria bacterium]|nr:flagellar motor protein MotA [Alphaproteobacteria bacterium]
MDLATVLGLVGGFALLLLAILLGGNLAGFVDVPSILITVVGTFAVTTVSFNLGEVMRAQRVLLRAAFHRPLEPGEAAVEMLQLSERARKEGILVLQTRVNELGDKPFLQKALQLVVDGSSSDEVDRMMRAELAAMQTRHANSVAVLRRAAEVAPAMGLIGTLVGLVQMLANLADPSTIGPAMAVALITTFYGAVMANMFFLPLATKLERISAEEALVDTLYLMGSISISRQENPRRLEMMVNTVLPPSKRIQYFE